jgi:tetratricopeptide (TPR) repeat protein
LSSRNPIVPKIQELDDELHRRITALSDSGNEKFEADRFREAYADYEKALKLIPEPLEKWEASTWVLLALADCSFLLGDYKTALRHLDRALDCPDIPGSEFLILRLGQTRYELGDEEGAREALADAWRLGGAALFEGEDPKYLRLLRSRADRGQRSS